MVYTKNAVWASDTIITSAKLDNLETQYTEGYAYYLAHGHTATYYTKTEMESTFWFAGNDGGGSGSDADLIYKASGNLHASAFAGLGIPTGLIILWYGAVGAIPSGWALCNGSGGTVDLRGRFVPGAGNTYNPGTTGGSATFTASGAVTINAHVLTIAEMAAHVHPFTDKSPVWYDPNNHKTGTLPPNGACSNNASTSGNTSSAGSSSGHGHSAGEGTSFSGTPTASLPFFYALCFIQKTA